MVAHGNRFADLYIDMKNAMIEKDISSEENRSDAAELPPMIIWGPIVLIMFLFVAWCCAIGRVAWAVVMRG